MTYNVFGGTLNLAQSTILDLYSTNAADYRQRDGGHDEGAFSAGRQEAARAFAQHEKRRRGISRRDEETTAS